MATVIINDDNLKITVMAPGGTKVGLVELAAAGFFERLSRYKATAPVKTLEMEQDALDPTLYHYEVELTDGKLWKQKITIASGQEAMHTFDVPVAWKQSAFVAQRDVREALIELIRNHGVTSLKCEW